MPRILLIAPTFFGYRQRVARELSRLGNEVDCLDDRPSEGALFKSFAKFGYALIDKSIAAYADTIRQQVAQKKYDHIIYMGGMSFCFTYEQMRNIREASSAHMTVYLWDALRNCRRLGESLVFFDEKYSFEPSDCRISKLTMRPLFYSDTYMKLPAHSDGEFEYDACFIGSVHQSSKFKSILAITKWMRESGFNVFTYFYMPSHSVEYMRKIEDRAYRGIEFQHYPMSAEQIASVYARSAAIIDSPQSGQNGLTMRTLETIGARRKLITVNEDICNYDFYDYGNVAIWNDETGVSGDFINREYCDLPFDVYESYSITSFVRTLIGEDYTYTGYRGVEK
ncbi:hypothetical protein [Bifidobacterium eulemuris]|uniref:Eps11J n=1 Tax=Bifidobacterium eulemuris TaxID=1765219 RepID=A0A261FXR9_9BIFI|nr:hypothetical protein [Bifidobacterium eulemuris]OZG63898.1 eps11J [Bifidobacterium eulemuris]QOL32425.1 hypothetical protein BE0216_08165 [Bifidobacterium eulemuris]